ncbi:carboxypeptidase regulatory-like domain-containing protein [Novosphingobium panipatense]|uniref:Uncharacterized conserved protein, contains GH25 family domain n=1 Tax=Novosphingobium panipatense TaxID=428991 RepID=A0ABY1QJV6_9SPHN|nr:carboxypeptidase regulatory-like domain-containing protein [Novosphingobium panipatense]SMP71555.1 Uncharacterized conserved protein, contains GH25 family domain [Novosphingobium panipatense]
MKFRYLTPFVLACMAAGAQAHEVWIERDGTGPARIYLGEPAEVLPANGDPEFHHLKAPKVLGAGTVAPVRKAGYLEVAVPAGDVRAQDDSVFAPWGADGRKEAVAYFARAGRAESAARMPFEITPVAANGDRFALVRDGKPVAGAEVTVIAPDKWTKTAITDSEGRFTAPSKGKGRYILTATQKDEGGAQTSQGQVAVLHRIATTTFVID